MKNKHIAANAASKESAEFSANASEHPIEPPSQATDSPSGEQVAENGSSPERRDLGAATCSALDLSTNDSWITFKMPDFNNDGQPIIRTERPLVVQQVIDSMALKLFGRNYHPDCVESSESQ